MPNQVTPDYDVPPVIETALGIEFSPLEKWNLPHFGLYWNAIRQKYQEGERTTATRIDD